MRDAVEEFPEINAWSIRVGDLDWREFKRQLNETLMAMSDRLWDQYVNEVVFGRPGLVRLDPERWGHRRDGLDDHGRPADDPHFGHEHE